MRMAGSGFWAATIPMQNSLITIITIPVQADIMAEDLTVAGITAAVLMVVAADMAGIEPRTTRKTRTCLTTKTRRHQDFPLRLERGED
jgi:hypothetical protein